MPQIDHEARRRRQEDAELLDRMARCAAEFRRSARGNLWRRIEGMTVTVLARRDREAFAWVIVDGEEKRWSSCDYDNEREALDGAVVTLFKEYLS